MSSPEVKKRLYVGGLAKDVTENELKKRFELFLTVSSVKVKTKTDSEGNHVKTFAHLDVQGSEAGLKKCYNAYQNAKWRGSVMKLEDAKESFLDRLAVEREESKVKEFDQVMSKKKKAQEWKPPELDNLKVAPVPGTPIPGKKDWVVGKYGRVLPVLNVKKSYVTKPVKHDPSKFCHASKVFKEDDADMSGVNCDTLTWEIDEPDSEITKKRKGEFPPDPRPKKAKPFPVELLKSPVKESFSNKPFAKENSSSKSINKEKSANKSKKNSLKTHEPNDYVEADSGSLRGDEGEENSEASISNDDGLEIVKVGGAMDRNSNSAIRSRFDSDYESDGEESSLINNNKTKTPPAKSSKKKGSVTQSSLISKDNSFAKKSKVAFSNKEDCESTEEISEFKGIGSLITKPVDISIHSSFKIKPSVQKDKALCNGKVDKQSEFNSEENNNGKVETSSKKKKGKRKSQADAETSSPKSTKKIVKEEKLSLKSNPLSTIQKDSSQYADLYLSEFVAKAPTKQQTRQKYDPYDSDLDSDNFEVVARKLAKNAGVEVLRENKRKTEECDIKALVKECSSKNAKNDITKMMMSLAGGYSGVRSTQTNYTQNKQKEEEVMKNSKVQEQIPQGKDLIPSTSKNKGESSTSTKKTVHVSNNKEEDNSDEEIINKGNNADEDNSASEDEEVKSSKHKDMSEDDKGKDCKVKKVTEESSSSDEEEVENEENKKIAENSSSSSDEDVAEDSSSSDEEEVENEKDKNIAENSSSSSDEDEDMAEDSSSSDEVEEEDDDNVKDAKAKSHVDIKAVPMKNKTKDSTTHQEEVLDNTTDEVSLAEEKKRNLQVLENVVGKTKVDKLTAKLKRDNVHIMDMNQLRFDPTKLKSHQSSKKESKTKKTNATLEKAVKNDEDSETETPIPQDMLIENKTPKQERKQKKESVDESKFRPQSEVTMSESLMTMLKTDTKSGESAKEKTEESSSFSLLDMFDKNNEEEAMETDSQSPVKPLSGLKSLTKITVNKKELSKDKGASEKDTKDKTKKKNAGSVKDKTEKKNEGKSNQALEKELKDAGKMHVRFTKEEWKERNYEIRQNMLKICKSRNTYAVRKKRIEEEQEKEKSVRKFGSWKKK